MHKVFIPYTYIYYENVQVVVGIADGFNTYCVDASLYFQNDFFFFFVAREQIFPKKSLR